MFHKASGFAFGAAKLLLVIGVNFVLFTLIPLLHALFGEKIDTGDTGMVRRQIVTEIVKKKKEPPKRTQRRTRQVKTAASRGPARNMQFKFSPDLGVEGAGGVAVQSGGEMEAMVFEEGETDVDARPRGQPRLLYPRKARSLGVEGVVLTEFVVGTNGRISDVTILKSPHESLSNAVKRALKGWRWEPAQNQGVPVKQRQRKPFEFNLED